MNFLRIYIFLIISTLLPGNYYAQKKLSLEISTGAPFNLPLPLTIRQAGKSDINLTAHYYSKPFAIPIFWDWRLSYWNGSGGWEIEAVHHKIFLSNKPLGVDEFSISHGLNLVTINRCCFIYGFILRTGAGIVIAHPESIVNNEKLSEKRGIFNWGYYISGPVIILSAGKRVNLIDKIFITLDAKIGCSYSYIPVSNGNAEVYNVAFMVTFGLGYDFLL